MRVLWFTNTACKYQSPSSNNCFNGGCWMSSLQTCLESQSEIFLGICFMQDGQARYVKQNGVDYYPVPFPRKTIKEKFRGYLRFNDISVDKYVWQYYIDNFRNVIDEFKPDIIQIFGSELYMGLASFATNVPCVLHIQGTLNPYKDVLFPPGMSKIDFVFMDWNPIRVIQRYYWNLWWERNCYRERIILKNIKHVIGRTDWDKRTSFVFNNERVYHFGEEIMREPFYHPLKRSLPDKLTINTVISYPYYKGYDLILKTAYCLKYYLGMDFEWNVYGNVVPEYFQKSLHILPSDVNVKLRGVASARDIVLAHSQATVYVHSSYIENSSNAVIEAQMCGCTPIVNFVGGLSTIVRDKDTGFWVPANDPYQSAYLIKYLFDNPKLNLEIGEKASLYALERHNPQQIVSELLQTYNDVINAN